jgi:hypothetical protein
MADDLKPADAPGAIYGPDGRPTFFSDPAIDRFAAAFTRLVGEVWVVKELIANLIETAEAKGALTAADIRAHAEGAGAAAREEELATFVRRVLGPMREEP